MLVAVNYYVNLMSGFQCVRFLTFDIIAHYVIDSPITGGGANG